MKSIIQNLAIVAKRKAVGCDKCGGEGEIPNPNPPEFTYPNDFPVPCPTCQPLRKVAKMCWHEGETCNVNVVKAGGVANWQCIHCNRVFVGMRATNSTPDIPTLRSYMEIVGVWEKFAYWVYSGDDCDYEVPMAQQFLYAMNLCTTDKFYSAVAEFLREEVEG